MNEKSLRVLLIEDNPGDAFLIKFYLGESTSPIFETHHAETLKQAHELLEQFSFDIILQDLNLPDSNGIESFKTFNEKYPGNLVLVLTGLTDEEVGLETVRYGAQDFLVKGKFDGKVLISSVIFAYERFNLNNRLNRFQKEMDWRIQRFNNLQVFLNIGVIEIHKSDEKVFVSNNAKRILALDQDDTFLAKSDFLKLFNAYPKAIDVAEKVAIESASGVKATIEFQEFDDKILGVIRLD